MLVERFVNRELASSKVKSREEDLTCTTETQRFSNRDHGTLPSPGQARPASERNLRVSRGRFPNLLDDLTQDTPLAEIRTPKEGIKTGSAQAKRKN